MEITQELLKKVLVDSGLISKTNFELAKNEAEEKGRTLQDLVLDKEWISEEELGQLIADEAGFPFIDLKKVRIDKQLLMTVPEVVARKQKIIVFDKDERGLKVAMAHPENLEIREFLERKTGENVIPYFALECNILFALKHYKKGIKEAFEEIVGKSLDEFKKIESKDLQNLPVAKILDLFLHRAYENQASDIHIEPYPDKTLLRYRIDGVLHDILTLPRAIHDFLVSRIKILARLRTDEHESAQDGHFSFEPSKEKMDVRVSIVPIENGEKAVLRLLAEKSRRLGLKDLGLKGKDLKKLKGHLKKSWGMILAVGPTGCGKTTTLYAILKILNIREANITTIEDPIEYDIEGVNQIQVNPKTNLTFSEGLRSIIRQDPNIIMIGEIRDRETASLAVNAAMTGHLVLSTFHAIDSASSLIRLIDMGIEPFIVATAVHVVIAQRLVRKICPGCIESFEMPIEKLLQSFPSHLIKKLFGTTEGETRLFRGKGCRLCQGTGYLGRTGIFEVLEMDENIKKLVMEKANASQIRKEAAKLGMEMIIEDGLKKIEIGITTIEEVLRASQE